jgi:acetyl esterase/lipase
MTYTLNGDGSVELNGRVVPVPGTISTEAKQSIRDAALRPPVPGGPLWDRRAELDAQMHVLNDVAQTLFPTEITEACIGGVRCHLVRASGGSLGGRALVNLHAGGFVTGSGSLVEAIPIAALTKATVIAVDYRLAPEHHFPAAVDDAVAVYGEVLKHHAPAQIGIFGTSAGAFLTAQTIMRLRRDDLPLPACAGVFTGGGDLTDLGDSAAIFNLGGFGGHPLQPYGHPHSDATVYLAGADPHDPVVSPLCGDLSAFPPTLLITSTRDALLSATALMHRALRRAGVNAELYVFEALPHGFWFNVRLPEAREAFEIMAQFMLRHVAAADHEAV